MELLYIFLGGAFGTVIRYITSLFFYGYPYETAGTFIVNMTGCFIIGFVSYLAIKRNNIVDEKLKKFFTIGLAGGLTTFSTFSYNIVKLFINHHYMYCILNIFFSIILGLIFVSWGMNCGYYLLNHIIKLKREKIRMEKNK